MWSTDEQDALQLIDRELDIYANEHKELFDGGSRVLHMWDAESGMIDNWHKYCQRQMRDNYHICKHPCQKRELCIQTAAVSTGSRKYQCL